MRILVCYVPVVHRGYVEFFRRYSGGVLYILGDSVTKDFDYLGRDIRANSPEEVAVMIRSLGIFEKVSVLEKDQVIQMVVPPPTPIVLPDEDISRIFAETYFRGFELEFESVFLRWNWQNIKKESKPTDTVTVSKEEFDVLMLGIAQASAVSSSDWWRQVGAVAVKDKKILCRAYNRHFPSEHTPYIMGDPRLPFKPGERIDLSSAGHAELRIVAWAAKNGVALEGASFYVTTFPCPGCAYALSELGIKRVYYAEGYSLVEGADVLRQKGIELIRVVAEKPSL